MADWWIDKDGKPCPKPKVHRNIVDGNWYVIRSDWPGGGVCCKSFDEALRLGIDVATGAAFMSFGVNS